MKAFHKKLKIKSEVLQLLTVELRAVRGGYVVTSGCSNNCSFTGDCDPPKP